MVLSAIKDSEQYKNCVRRNSNANDFLINQQYTSKVLASVFNRQNELKAISNGDV